MHEKEVFLKITLKKIKIKKDKAIINDNNKETNNTVKEEINDKNKSNEK
jgi:hypothetical protein